MHQMPDNVNISQFTSNIGILDFLKWCAGSIFSLNENEEMR